jgi:trimeric autotransporter adhesin
MIRTTSLRDVLSPDPGLRPTGQSAMAVPHARHPLALGLLACVAGSSLLSAQCANPWVSTGGFPGVDGTVCAATMYDPDGPGPAPVRLVLGGAFGVIGTVPANNIATWDPATGALAPLGGGLPGTVQALVTMPNGELVAGVSTFSSATSAFCVARWNGATWLPIGAGFLGSVTEIFALTVLPNGDLVAAGDFAIAGGVPANNIARWDGTAWSALGTGLDGRVASLTTLPNGDLVAAGWFAVVGGFPTNGVARWNGSVWTPLGPGPTGSAGALMSLPNGDLLAGFSTTFGTPATSTIHRWNGSAWAQVGAVVMPGRTRRIETLPNGDFVVAGGDGPTDGFCQRWNGVAWSSVGPSPSGAVLASTQLPNGNLVLGGFFADIGTTSARGLARWDGAAWNAFGVPGLAGKGQALFVLPNGDVLAGGDSVVRWNGSVWSPLGAFAANASVQALTALPNGDVVAGGSLAPSGPAAHLARWNGTSWLPLGTGVNGTVRALATRADGSLIAGGSFSLAGGASAPGIARWNGTAWSSLAGGVTDSFAQPGSVSALAIAPNGDLFVGGGFTRAGTVVTSNIARWNGSAWSALGTGLNGTVRALAVLPNGDLLAGGGFLLGGSLLAQVVRWNGATWSAVGAGGPTFAVTSIAVLPNGEFLVGSDLFAQGLSPVWLARWNGSSWSTANLGVDRYVDALAFHPSGEVFVGGRFAIAGGVVSPGVARLTTTCPATANANGTGCTGVGGLNVLAARSLPWVGSTCRMIASGLPAASLAVAVTGWSSVSIPLAAILPQGSPGCALLANPDLLAAVTTGAGEVPVALAIPNSVALSGVVVHQQVVALQIVAGNIAAATSTNALTLTCGAF